MITKLNATILTALMLINPMLAAPSSDTATSYGTKISNGVTNSLSFVNESLSSSKIRATDALIWVKNNKVKTALGTGVIVGGVLLYFLWKRPVLSQEENAAKSRLSSNKALRLALVSALTFYTQEPTTNFNLEPYLNFKNDRSLLEEDITFNRLYNNFNSANGDQKITVATQMITYLKSF